MTSRSAKKLIILGAGGHGRVVADIAELHGFEEISFLDQNLQPGSLNLRWRIVGRSFEDVAGPYAAFVAIGNNKIRSSKIYELLACEVMIPTLIHPMAAISRYVKIDHGTVVMAQAVINAGAIIGRGVIANSACTIDHDCKISNGVHISPGANIAGGVSIGAASWIGIGACVREGVRIGCNVVVGAGSVVISDVEDDATVFGNPAKLKEKRT